MQFLLLFSRQGKLRLQKWFVAYPEKLKKKITRELVTTILARKPKMSSFLEYKELKIVYKRYLKFNFNLKVLTASISHASLQVCQPILLFSY